MMGRSLLVICLTAAVCAAGAAPAPQEGPRQIRLAPQSTAKQVVAFRYRLLPGPRDRTSGNAAPLWRLAGDALQDAKPKMTNQQWDWAGRDWAGQTPLNKLPRQEVHDFLKGYIAPVRLARQAACREHCDWELPPITFQSIQVYLPLRHIQRSRELAVLLGIQFRLELAEGRFDDAAETLQTGFALARHLYQGERLIEILIGNAIDAIMFSHVEEWMQVPDSPNLYWSLTALAPPRTNLSRCIEQEMNSLYRSFPKLRRLDRETFTPREADGVVNEIFDLLNTVLDHTGKPPDSIKKMSAAIREGTMYPQARKHLEELGRSAKEIDAMPKAQVILLWYVDQYDRAWDKVFEALTVPTWHAHPLMEAVSKEFRSSDNIFLILLLPALEKNWTANVRNERQLAGLRGAEALRLYAATHQGKPPAKWSDITAVPLPVDPITGKGFDDFYQVKDGRGILEIPPPPPINAPFLGRRYELAPR